MSQTKAGRDAANPGQFANKVVWISGGAQGIGKGIVEYFAAAGAKVVINDIKTREGTELAESIRQRGGEALFIFCDLIDERSIRDSITETIGKFGALHILVNNAAVNLVKYLHEFTIEEWDWQMNINLRAYFISFKYAYPHLIKNEKSYVVNIGSVSSFIGQAKTPGYLSSKGGVLMLSKAIALDYADKGLRCNVVCPGITDTPLLREHAVSEEALHRRLKRVPMAKLLSPKNIASAVAFLCSEQSDGITGTEIVVDGGYTATAEWEG